MLCFEVVLNLNFVLGPDICGPGTKKVHVIFNYKGKNHLINKEIRCKVIFSIHCLNVLLNLNVFGFCKEIFSFKLSLILIKDKKISKLTYILGLKKLI